MANDEYKTITIRVPKKLYADYKETLRDKGAIVTYDLRNYMAEFVQANTKGNQ